MQNINTEPADISVYVKDKGIVLREKSLLAFDMTNNKIIAIGTEAENYMQAANENIKVISPLRQGMIADYIVAFSMFSDLLRKALGKRFLIKPVIAVCVPTGITEVEKKAMEDMIYQAGAREVFIAETPLEQFVRELPEEFPELYSKCKIIIGIGKDEPERYVEEKLRHTLAYARQLGISGERVGELFDKISSENA